MCTEDVVALVTVPDDPYALDLPASEVAQLTGKFKPLQDVAGLVDQDLALGLVSKITYTLGSASTGS
jgi:hypothetical protein